MLFYGLFAAAGYGITQIEPARLWPVGRMIKRPETLDAIRAGLALKNAVEHPEIWYATHDVECTPVLWPKDRLYGLARLIEEKRHDEVIWAHPVPETFSESALWGLKRVRDALAQKFSGAAWSLKKIQKVAAPIVSNPGDIKLAAEYYRDHPTLSNFAISTYFNVRDFFNRRRFRNEHENDYMVYLNAEHYENQDLEWVNLPKGLEKEIYAAMKDIPKLEAPPTPGFFSRALSALAGPFTFFKKMVDDYKVLSARREAKAMLMDDVVFPGFNLLITQDFSNAKLTADTAINELARILLDKKSNATEQINELKRTISNYAVEIELQQTKDNLLNDIERLLLKPEELAKQITALNETLKEQEELIKKTQEAIEHEIELGKWALTALEVAHRKLDKNPENREKIISETIPAYEKQVENAMSAQAELSNQLHQFKMEKNDLQYQSERLNTNLTRSQEPCSQNFIESYRAALNECEAEISDYIIITIQSAPNLDALRQDTIETVLKCALHPNLKNLPEPTKDRIFYYILNNNKSSADLNQYYDNYLSPILDLAKTGINRFSDTHDRWFGPLLGMADEVVFNSKIKAIQNAIKTTLEQVAREELSLHSNDFWQSALKNLDLFDIPDLDEHQKLFNDRILEHDILRNLIRKLQQELYETGSISKETKESIPKLIEDSTKEFFQTLKSAQTKLREEKGDELNLLSESFRKMYEYWATSLMIDSVPKASKDELERMESEIDRLALRFKLYAIRQLLFPFVEQDPKYQALPDLYKARLLDTVVCADTLNSLVSEWKLVPQKLDIISRISQHSGIEKIPLEICKILIDKITLSHSEPALKENYKQIQIVIKNIGKIQDHPKFSGISKDQENGFYRNLMDAPLSEQRTTIESILNQMTALGKGWGNWLRSWGTTTVQVAQTISDTSMLMTGIQDMDPSPHQTGPYNSFTPTASLQLSESQAVQEIKTLLSKDTIEKDELLGTLETLLKKDLLDHREPESPNQKADPMKTVRQALSKTIKSTSSDPENERSPDPNSPKSTSPNKKSGA